MHRIFSLISFAVMAALSFVSSIAAVAVDYALAFIPDLASAGAHFNFDNSHPRSPLASLRAGLA